MNTTQSKGFAHGAHVAFTSEAAELFTSAANRIFEVTDSRCLNGVVEYALAPVQAPAAANATHFAFAEDLREVGREAVSP